MKRRSENNNETIHIEPFEKKLFEIETGVNEQF